MSFCGSGRIWEPGAGQGVGKYFRERGVEFPGDELLKAAKGDDSSGRRFLEYLKKSLL
jgi:hypothetical protein